MSSLTYVMTCGCKITKADLIIPPKTQGRNGCPHHPEGRTEYRILHCDCGVDLEISKSNNPPRSCPKCRHEKRIASIRMAERNKKARAATLKLQIRKKMAAMERRDCAFHEECLMRTLKADFNAEFIDGCYECDRHISRVDYLINDRSERRVSA